MSEADVDDMAVEAEPSYQYSITCCCHATDGSREAVWQHGVWHGSAYGAKVCHWILPCGKNGTHWHSLMLTEHLWRPNIGCDTVRQWVVCFGSGDRQRVTSTGTDIYKCTMQALVHCSQKCTFSGDAYVERQWLIAENLLYQIALICSSYLL